MVDKYLYRSIQDTMVQLINQINDSIDYAHEHCPRFDNPCQLYNYLKTETIFKHDPPGVELLQSMPTMMSGRYTGIAGAGDCDCLTITTTACMISQGWDNIIIYLVGRKKSYPVHIYNGIIWKNKETPFDLTSKMGYGTERPYKYRQSILYN